ncbi:hypothetical protein KO566_09085 [Flavobacteriaceae bacterium XHP0103]|uniref:hypothetical protein n=1 Tax=Marixanthotalea marina TaxID=2844359 RepID=UPI002989E95A|nr:hypothetical protein [Marixanthotalea marina]MBU3822212.1 hypothetical protein [Marixanthotalea marina]
MTNNGELYLENKYGTITINGWEKNNIAIVANISVTDDKKEKAKDILDRINSNIVESGDFISVVSEISDRDIGFFARYFNKINPFDLDKGNVEINYTINLPINAEVELINSFGDVILDNWTGKLKATIEHGNMWISKNLTNANISMSFGKLRAKSITYGTVSLKNGSIDFEDSKDIRLKTSGSYINAKNIFNLDIVSSKDEILIDHIDNLYGEANFSNIEIKSIEKQVNLQLKVTEFRVLKINSPDPYLNIGQESSDISINVNQLNFKFDATLEEGILRLSKSFSNIKSEVIDKNNRVRKVSATFGKPKSGIFTFTGKKGIITLKD